jgi:hypothetical protein
MEEAITKSPDEQTLTQPAPSKSDIEKYLKSDPSRYKFKITPEYIQSVIEQNKIELPEASKLREEYYKKFEALQPQKPEDFDQPGFRDTIDKTFEEFRKKLPTVPYAPQSSAPRISLPSGQKAVSISPETTFEEYAAPYRDTLKERLREKFEENLEKDPTKTYTESDLDKAVEFCPDRRDFKMNRAIVKVKMGEKETGRLELEQLLEDGFSEAAVAIEKFCD